MRSLRIAAASTGLIVLAFGLAFAFRVESVTRLWPWPDGPLSYLFVGSILAAVSAALIWIGWSGDFGALAGGALNVFIIGVGSSFYLLEQAFRAGRLNLIPYGIAGGVIAAASILAYLWSRRLRVRESKPTPSLVRVSFWIFMTALVLASAGLLFRAPIFPWALNPDSSVMFGCFFLGNACYFLYGIIRPIWPHARGQLLSFLAYDLVLIGPFLLLFKSVKPQFVLSLVLYVLVLLFSGAIAVYFLFVDPRSRFGATS